MLTAASHQSYARLFVFQRIQDIFNTLNKSGDGQITVTELQEYLTFLNYKATKKQVHDMVWEVDDSCDGVIRIETIRALLARMQKAKTRGVGTGSNLLRTLVEYMVTLTLNLKLTLTLNLKLTLTLRCSIRTAVVALR